jgi:hypothetical protein
MEKLGDAFKAIIAAFHGIIATWLFTEFSERKIDEFYFVILLVFFTVANVLVWNALLYAGGKLYWVKASNSGRLAFQNDSYRFKDAIGLTVVAICLGLLAARLDRSDVVLRLANMLPTDWYRTASDLPLEALMIDIKTTRLPEVDRRSKKLVTDAKAEGYYLRLYVKDSKLAYEGYPAQTTTRGEIADRELILSPACRFFIDEKDPTRIATMQRIEGPGVFLRLANVVAVEVVDARQSACKKLEPQ